MNLHRLSFALVLLAGCPPLDTICTLEARPSIRLSVVDDLGVPVPGATATYTANGAELQPCFEDGPGGLTCAWEVAGDFVVTIEAPGFEPDTFTQFVDEDECHVITEMVERTLMPINCTDIALPSIEVSVTDSKGTSIESADVVWNMAAEDDLPEPCTSLGGNVWTCGEEVAGELVVEISNAGPYEAYREVVTVSEDECHVITESLSAVLQVLAD
ncbi:MAG: hypothetical protein AAGA48_24900 [Myxococcota bacterium]